MQTAGSLECDCDWYKFLPINTKTHANILSPSMSDDKSGVQSTVDEEIEMAHHRSQGTL